MSIPEKIQLLEAELTPQNCQLVAVSKTKPHDLIMEAYHAGFKRFGENRVQELVEKHQALPKDIEWHMIGHLQRNKVKYIAPFVDLIHGVDNLKLLAEIEKQALKNQREIPCLLQIHIAQEQSKFGFNEQEIMVLFEEDAFESFTHVRIKGLMGMATFTTDESQVRSEFRTLAQLFQNIKQNYSLPNVQMEVLSMGMSNDYQIAVQEGSTMVRIGSSIFGSR